MGLDAGGSAARVVHLGEQRVEHGQGFQIAGLAGARVGKEPLEALHDQAEGIFGLTAEESAETAAQNDQEFRRLEENTPFPV